MKPIKFPEHNVIIAKDQPQYLPLPAHTTGKLVTVCWKLSWRERIKLFFTGLLWHQIMTFYLPLQPQKLMTEKPEIRNEPKS